MPEEEKKEEKKKGDESGSDEEGAEEEPEMVKLVPGNYNFHLFIERGKNF
jgi:hypothetical protein